MKNTTAKKGNIAIFILIVLAALTIGIFSTYTYLKSKENKVPPSSNPSNNSGGKVSCPQIDAQANVINSEKTYARNDFIPLESRITTAFRFSGGSVLFFKYYAGFNNSIHGEKGSGVDQVTGVQIPNIVYADKNNGDVFVDQFSLPQIFNPSNAAPPIYSDFFGMLEVAGVNNKFYFLSGSSCSYGNGVCSQKLVSLSNDGYKVEEVKIPQEYAPKIQSWQGGQEGGVSNINTFFKDIVEVKNNLVTFRTSDMSKTKTSKYITLDTDNNSWSENNAFTGTPIKYPYDVLKTTRCVSYATELGDYIVIFEKGVTSQFPGVGDTTISLHIVDKDTIGLYFVIKK
jgi:hypothetical protein